MKINEFAFPCATYALRRTGNKEDVWNLMDLKGWDKISFSPKELKGNDIVCWVQLGYETDITIEIENGIPITKSICVKKHFGVYEGNGLISDITVDTGSYCPNIRVRKLSEIREPSYIVRKRM